MCLVSKGEKPVVVPPSYLSFKFLTNSSMLILSMRMKSPRPTLVWSAMITVCPANHVNNSNFTEHHPQGWPTTTRLKLFLGSLGSVLPGAVTGQDLYGMMAYGPYGRLTRCTATGLQVGGGDRHLISLQFCSLENST